MLKTNDTVRVVDTMYLDYLDSEIALWTPLHFRLVKHKGETWWMELTA